MAIEKLMVAAPLVSTEVGQEYASLPPHVTIFPWFEMPESHWHNFDAAMRGIIERTAQPVIKGGERALFGPDETIPVRRLNHPASSFNTEEGLAIHKAVHNAVIRSTGDFDPNYVGSRWNPHVSDHAQFSLDEHEEIILPELVVLQRTMGHKLIRAIYQWEKVSV